MDKNTVIKNSTDLEVTIKDCESKLQDEVENRNSLQIRLATSSDRSAIRAVTQQLDFANRKIELIALELIKLFKRQMVYKDTIVQMQEPPTSLPTPSSNDLLPINPSLMSINDYNELQKKFAGTESTLQKIDLANSEMKKKNNELESEVKSLRSQLEKYQKSSGNMENMLPFPSEIKDFANSKDRSNSSQSLKIDSLIPELSFLSQTTFPSRKDSEKELANIPSLNPPIQNDHHLENAPSELIEMANTLFTPVTFNSQKASFLKADLQIQCQTQLEQVQSAVAVWIQCIVHLKYYHDKLQIAPNTDYDLSLSILLSILCILINKLFPIFKGESNNNCTVIISDLFKGQNKRDPLSIRPPQEEAKDILSLKQQFMKLKEDYETLQYHSMKNEELVKDLKSRYEPEGERVSLDNSNSEMKSAENAEKEKQRIEEFEKTEESMIKSQASVLELQKEVDRRDRALLQLEADLNESKERFNVLLKYTEDQKGEFDVLLNQLKEEMNKLAEDNEFLQDKLADYEDEILSRDSINSASPTVDELQPINQVVARNFNSPQEQSIDLTPVSPPTIENEKYEELQRDLEDKISLVTALDKRLKNTELELRKKERKIRHLENSLKQNGINYVTNLDTSGNFNPNQKNPRPESLLSEISSDSNPVEVLEKMEKELFTLQVAAMSDKSAPNSRNSYQEQEAEKPSTPTFSGTPRSSGIRSGSAKVAFDDILYQLQVESQGENEEANRSLNVDKEVPPTVHKPNFDSPGISSIQERLQEYSSLLDAANKKVNEFEEKISIKNEEIKLLEDAIQKMQIEKMEFVHDQEESEKENKKLLVDLISVQNEKEDLLLKLQEYENEIEVLSNAQPAGFSQSLDGSMITRAHSNPPYSPSGSENVASRSIGEKWSFSSLFSQSDSLKEKSSSVHIDQEDSENKEKEIYKPSLNDEEQEAKIQSLSKLIEEQKKSLSMNDLKITSLKSDLTEYESLKEMYVKSQEALYLAKEQVHSLHSEKEKLIKVMEELQIELNISQMDIETMQLQHKLPDISTHESANEKRDSWIAALNIVEEDGTEVENLKAELAELKKKMDYSSALLEHAEARGNLVVLQLETLKNKDLQLANLEAQIEKLKASQEDALSRGVQIQELQEMVDEKDKLIQVKEEVELHIRELIHEKEELIMKMGTKIDELTREKEELIKGMEIKISDLMHEKEELIKKMEIKSGDLMLEREELTKEMGAKMGNLELEKEELTKKMEMKIASLTLEKEELAKEMQSKIANLTLEKEELKKEMDIQMCNLSAENQNLADKIETLKDDLQASIKDKEKFAEKLKMHEENLVFSSTKNKEIHDHLSGELEFTKSQCEGLEVELQKAQSEMQTNLQRSIAYNELLAKSINLESMTDCFKKENSVLMSKVRELEESLNSKKESTNDYELLLEEANSKILTFQKQIEEYETILQELSILKLSHQETLALVDDLKHQASRSDTRIQELSDQLEVTLSTKESLQQELEDISNMLHTLLEQVSGSDKELETSVSRSVSDVSKLRALGNIFQDLRRELAAAYEEQDKKLHAFMLAQEKLEEAALAKENIEMELSDMRDQLRAFEEEKEKLLIKETASIIPSKDTEERYRGSIYISAPDEIGTHTIHKEPLKQEISFSSPRSFSNNGLNQPLGPENSMQDNEGQVNLVSMQREIEDLRTRIAATADYEYKHRILCDLVAKSQGMEGKKTVSDEDVKEKSPLPSDWQLSLMPSTPSYLPASPISPEDFPFSDESMTNDSDSSAVEKASSLQKTACELYDSCQETLTLIKHQLDDLEEKSKEVTLKEETLENMISKYVLLKTTMQQHQETQSVPVEVLPDEPRMVEKKLELIQSERLIDSDADTESLRDDASSSQEADNEPTPVDIASKGSDQSTSMTDLISSIQSKILSRQADDEIGIRKESHEKEYMELLEKIQDKVASLTKASPLASAEQLTLLQWVERYETQLQNAFDEERRMTMNASEKTIALLTSDFEDQEKALLGQLKKQKTLVTQLQVEKASLTKNLTELETDYQKLETLIELCKDEAEEREEELLTNLAKVTMEKTISQKEISAMQKEIEALRESLKNMEENPALIQTANESDLEKEYKKLEQKLLHYEDQMNEIMEKNMELVMQLSEYK